MKLKNNSEDYYDSPVYNKSIHRLIFFDYEGTLPSSSLTNDINDIELDKHHSDTVQEKLSLVSRFGITIGYIRPNKKDFEAIVSGLAERHPEITMSKEKLLAEATKWEISHGGMSGRVARQFIDYIVSIHS